MKLFYAQLLLVVTMSPRKDAKAHPVPHSKLEGTVRRNISSQPRGQQPGLVGGRGGLRIITPSAYKALTLDGVLAQAVYMNEFTYSSL